MLLFSIKRYLFFKPGTILQEIHGRVSKLRLMERSKMLQLGDLSKETGDLGSLLAPHCPPVSHISGKAVRKSLSFHSSSGVVIK